MPGIFLDVICVSFNFISLKAHFVFCFSGLFIPRYKVEPLFGSSSIITALGSNVTLAWFCHTQGNHTLDEVHWAIVLHSAASRSPLLVLKQNLGGNIKITRMQDRAGRVQWTGNASQGNLSFVIYDVRHSDDLLYRIRLTLTVPDASTVTYRKSYSRVNVAGNKRDNIHVALKY